jgi:TonB family protein
VIVLPADFETRYSDEQQTLMLAHERMHIVRGDLHANALTAAMRCVFWFNQLLHAAARHFRQDQELACDLRVIARHPHARRAYGEAMFKTQLALHPLPLGCHWLAGDNRSHPLKERIAMLKQPVPSLTRWAGGAVLVVALAFGVGFAAWSSQPKRDVATSHVRPGQVMAQLSVSIDGGKPERFSMLSDAGEQFAMRTEHAGQHWDMQATASPRSDGTIAFDSTLRRDGKLVGSPKLIVRNGESAGIEIGEKNDANGAFEGIKLGLVLTAAAPPPPPPAPPAPPAAPAPPSPPPAPAMSHTPQVAPVAPPPPVPAVAPLPPPPEMPAVGRMSPPAYPPAALAQRIEGKVVLLIDVDAQGNPVNVVVDKSEPAGVFDQSAIDAARQWKFQPAVEKGHPVAGRISVPVQFAMHRPSESATPEAAPAHSPARD